MNQTYHKRYLLGVEIALMQLYIMAMVVILLAFKTNQMRNSHAYHSNVSFQWFLSVSWHIEGLKSKEYNIYILSIIQRLLNITTNILY